MCLESAQLLCTAHWIAKYIGYVPRKLDKMEMVTLRGLSVREIRDFPYLPNHYNHPCAIWVRKSLDNYEWLYCLALCP